MKITCWGCRGSLPTPDRDKQHFGGNTTCLEIETTAGERIIIDAGSGIRNLGKALCTKKVGQHARFFFTHSHWDHLMGFPFFSPAYSEDFTFSFCSGAHAQETIRDFLSHQMEPPYFPVDFSAIRAKTIFHCDNPNNEPRNCHCFGAEVRPINLSHPNGGFGYKIIDAGVTCVFLSDNELGFSHPGRPDHADFVDFCRRSDLLIHDAQYTDSEYALTRGWGHSTFADATDLAIAAEVGRFGIFHHDPDRSDSDLHHQVSLCRERIHRAGSSVECFAMAEGMELVFGTKS